MPIAEIKQLMSQYKSIQNPQYIFDNLAQQRPEVKTIMALQQKNGVSLKQIAEIMAQQKGINLNNLIQQLNSLQQIYVN